MNAHPPQPRRGLFGRPVLTVTIVLAALAGMGLGGVALANRDSSPGTPRWEQPPAATGRPSPQPKTESTTDPDTAAQTGSITLSATGDIIMGSAPNRLPANGGDGFFDSVQAGLKSDLVMGNLDQPLTDDTGTSKCGSPPRANCYAFRSPPSYAGHLADAGFELMNTANNHSKDFGAAGFRSTQRALESAGLKHTGAEDEITLRQFAIVARDLDADLDALIADNLFLDAKRSCQWSAALCRFVIAANPGNRDHLGALFAKWRPLADEILDTGSQLLGSFSQSRSTDEIAVCTATAWFDFVRKAGLQSLESTDAGG